LGGEQWGVESNCDAELTGAEGIGEERRREAGPVFVPCPQREYF